MSRIEEEREAARQAERLLIQQREQERRAQERVESESAFAKLVAKDRAQKLQSTERTSKDSTLDRALRESRHDDESTSDEEVALSQAAREKLERIKTLKRGKLAGEEQRFKSEAESRGTVEGRTADEHAASHAADGRFHEGLSQHALEDGHTGEARKKGQAQDDEQHQSGAEAGRSSKKQERRVGADDKNGQKNGGKGSGEGEGAATFRFNPALMAPVPIAKPKNSSAAERLRALASEIAQKIVERVRIGKNAAGEAEFQMDLRSNVLSGLAISVSGSNGKIRAVFSGSDREVLKLLREQSESLKKALEARSLRLEELRIEERS